MIPAGMAIIRAAQRVIFNGLRHRPLNPLFLAIEYREGSHIQSAGGIRMPERTTVLPTTPKRIGVAADHGGYELKE